MKKLIQITLAFAVLASACFAQRNTLSSTTVTAAITASARSFAVGSVTGMTVASANAGTAGSMLYVNDTPGGAGEAMIVTSIDTTNLIVGVRRTAGNKASAHLAGAFVLYGPQNFFKSVDPQGACTATNTEVTPMVNIVSGAQWLCSTVTLSWVPGWNNPLAESQAGVTAAVASAAGVIVPSGPLFHVTGALAITGFTLPLGFVGGSFCIIPDGNFTTTTAGNVALASTAVTSKALCYTYDKTAAKPFFPSY